MFATHVFVPQTEKPSKSAENCINESWVSVINHWSRKRSLPRSSKNMSFRLRTRKRGRRDQQKFMSWQKKSRYFCSKGCLLFQAYLFFPAKNSSLNLQCKNFSKNIWSYPQTQAHLAVIALNMLLGFSIGFIRVISLKVSSASTRRWGSPWAMAEVLSGWNLRRAFLYAALTCHSQSVF